MNIKKIINFVILITIGSSCSISPGMHMETDTSWLNESRFIYKILMKSLINH